MCRAKEYSEQLKNIFQSIKEDVAQTTVKLSQIDLKESDVLHCIEFGIFNACEGYKICKILKEIRTERRKIKTELETLYMLRNDFVNPKQKDLNVVSCRILQKNNAPKIYVFKPKVLDATNVKELCK